MWEANSALSLHQVSTTARERVGSHASARNEVMMFWKGEKRICFVGHELSEHYPPATARGTDLHDAGLLIHTNILGGPRQAARATQV
jgi:hypothetical protein